MYQMMLQPEDREACGTANADDFKEMPIDGGICKLYNSECRDLIPISGLA